MKQGDVIEVVFSSFDTTSQASFNNVLHLRVTAFTSNLSTWLYNVGLNFQTKLSTVPYGPHRDKVLGYFPTSWNTTALNAHNINTPDEQASTSFTLTGGSRAETYDPRASVLIRLNTGLRGRTYRGFIYLPPPSEGIIISGGKLVGVAIQTFREWSTDLRVLGDRSNQGILVVHSRKLSTQSVVFNTAVTGTAVAAGLASQRRRRKSVV